MKKIYQLYALILATILFLSITFMQGCSGNDDDPLAGIFEEGEQFSGGETTVFDVSVNAFGNAAPNLIGDKDLFFVSGNSIFNVNWVTAPASTEDLDGLGPVFNARSCSACHFKDGRGQPPPLPGEDALSLIIQLSVPGAGPNNAPIPEPNYGGQLNNRAILGVPVEGKLQISWQEIPGNYPDGTAYSLRKAILEITELGYGPMAGNTLMSPRVAPHMVGMGLLEAIDESTLLALADPEDSDSDGISGRINQVWDVTLQQLRPGRFGWKANKPSVLQQVTGAFHGDIGISSSVFPDQPCADSQADCNEAADGGQPELTDRLLDRVVLYSSALAVPRRRNWDDPDVLRGKQLFIQANCTGCHTPKITTGTHPDFPEFSDQTIRPYTDLLLHDMGEGLADGRPDFEATGNEWRTPPLWGIGLVQTVNGHTNFLHDGRARNLEEAILWHAGEAAQSKEAYMNFNQTDRQKLITFLNSL